MSKVIRYFHIRPFDSTHGGTTVKVTGDLDILGQVDIQIAKCSKKDNYVKKIGRAECEKSPIKIIPLRYLPQELSRVSASQGKHPANLYDDFTYAIKYFLPKE